MQLNIKRIGEMHCSLGRKKLMKHVNVYAPLKVVFLQHTKLRVN